jgi:hypothetical protein
LNAWYRLPLVGGSRQRDASTSLLFLWLVVARSKLGVWRVAVANYGGMMVLLLFAEAPTN